MDQREKNRSKTGFTVDCMHFTEIFISFYRVALGGIGLLSYFKSFF